MKRHYHYDSGHSKRMKKARKLEQEKLQEGSIFKYCNVEKKTDTQAEVTNNELESENNVAVASTSTDSCSSSSSNYQPEELKTPDSEEEVSKNEESIEIIADPALWNKVSDQMRDYFSVHPPSQNIEKLHTTERNFGNTKRCLTEQQFYRTSKTGEKLNREWLVLSLSNFSVYCYVCKLFSNCSSNLATSGFHDWKHVSERLAEHENSFSHRKAICSLASRKDISCRIDSQIVQQYEAERKYWHDVLTRVVAVIKFLSKRGLSFFGDNETLGSPHNGNFLGCLELISEFDPFLAQHLQNFANPGKGNVCYLSSSVANEFILLMANKVLWKILKQVKQSKYFSIILDSTPDLSHTDQLSFVVRYVDESSKPVERFLTFLPIEHHDSLYLANTVFSTLENYKLDIMDIRGQSYDNASNMSGRYTGLQARIRELNPLAHYVPCSAHTLNLVAVHSVGSCTRVIAFFSFLQALYKFFSVSTHRWNILKEECRKNNKIFSLKSHSSTRWYADADATKAVRLNYKEIVTVLSFLSESSGSEPAITKHEASSLLGILKKLETTINVVVWDTVLQRLNKVSKQFQNSTENLQCVLPLLESLVFFVQYVREHFDMYEQEAKLINPDAEFEESRMKRVPKSKHLDDGDAAAVNFSPKDNFRVNCHHVLCDALISQLTTRKTSYENIMDKFSFLINYEENELSSKAHSFQKLYDVDLDDSFADEFLQFVPIGQKFKNVADTLQYLHELNLRSTFPNVETALKIFLTLPISNCTTERSFSLLKRLKSPMRTTLGQDKLSALTILSFENDITSNINYDDIISEFAEKKARKKQF